MTTYDADGRSLDPNDPTGIDPTHPNYVLDKRYDRARTLWARSRGNAVYTPPETPLTSGVQSQTSLASASSEEATDSV